MKKLRNVMFVFLVLAFIICLTLGLLFRHYSSPVGGSNEMIKVTLKGNNAIEMAETLEKEGLIRSTTFFKIYLKLFNIDGKELKAGTYNLNKEMSLREIIDALRKGNNYNEDEISITFREGITMRDVAKVIANNTNNKEEDVMNLLKDTDYLKELITKYWFITEDILDSKIYYSLEGYLFPETYRFQNKDVTVKEIFAKLLDQMDTILKPYKEDIEKSTFKVHEILTLASIAEKEVKGISDYREKVVSVFENRLSRGMSLGSDVTTRYSLKIDDQKQVLKKSQYAAVNAYNTRSTTMAGKLPAGPISTVSEKSIKAVLYHDKTDYIYFIANIQTGETFFYTNAREFEAKKAELSKVNGGL